MDKEGEVMARKYDPEDVWQWYFTPGPRMIITIPILLLFGLNALWYFLLAFLVPIDLLLWNFWFFLFFGLTVSWFIGAISVVIASLAVVLLPNIWDGWNVSSFVKFPAWIALAAISSFVPSITSGLGLNLLQWLGMPLRATGWWYGIAWGFQ
ncbi:MAG: hypothetical protein HY663_07145 [Chloroflexi bacterium]|nr:hypothetical protein [Chloroflexota bacterium]